MRDRRQSAAISGDVDGLSFEEIRSKAAPTVQGLWLVCGRSDLHHPTKIDTISLALLAIARRLELSLV